jgi:MFS family permease
MENNRSRSPRVNNRKAYIAILLLGLISLMGDVVYEGSRGLVPDYLGFLGATSVVVGLIGGLGDFLGYALRLVTGFLSDLTRAYWVFIFVGYSLIVSIPLLGFSYGLELAVLLVLLERMGKALRSPSRDAVLSVVSKDIGAGKAFGLHELLDQVGAVIGPAIVAFVMFSTANNYHYAFSYLLIPFLLMIVFLVYTYRKIGSKPLEIPAKVGDQKERIGKPFYIYTLAVFMNTVGLIPYTLILFKVAEIVRPLNQDWIVPLIYVLIQGVDAPAAFLSGYGFDRYGMKILVVPFLLSVVAPMLAMSGSGLALLAVAAAFFGLVLGMQESIYRAAVSKLTPLSSRGTAYGAFHTVYGVGLVIAGAAFGLFIQFGLPFYVAVAYVVSIQIIAVLLLLKASMSKSSDATSSSHG